MSSGGQDAVNAAEDVEKLKPYISALDRNPPTSKHVRLSKLLKEIIDAETPLESASERKVREKIVVTLATMINDWVVETCKQKGVPEEEAKLGGKLYISGSYRLAINTKSSDIDTICCVPRHIDRDDFFSNDPGGFVYRLRHIPEVSHVLPIEEAMVPIIEVVWNGVELDVLFVRVERNVVPELSQILDDNILRGLDRRSVMAINGPRVTELVVKLVPNYETFAVCLRVLRLWAKRRGIYSNKMGFLGGVNWNILVAFACQLYPTAAAAKLLLVFFGLYLEWKWPTEIRLCHPYDVDYLDLKQWDPALDRSEKYHVMPIITPAYPCQNSSYNVSWSTLDIMLNEFARAKEICSAIFKLPKSQSQTKEIWAELFEPSDFFYRFGTFVTVDVYAGNDSDLHSWSGYIESRLRKLVDSLQRLPLRKIYPFPKRFEHHVEDPDNPASDGKKACRWYIGILRHPLRGASRKRLDMSWEVAMWTRSLLVFKGYNPTMGVDVSMCKWSELPDDPAVFPEGKMEAVPVRRMWAARVKEEQDEIRKSKVNNPVIPHRVWTKEDDARDLEKAKNFSSMARTQQEEAKPEATKVEEGKGENSGAEPEATGDAVSSKAEGSSVVEENGKVDARTGTESSDIAVKEEKDDDDDGDAKKRQDLLAKRLREERSMSAMNKRLKVVNNFEQLPRVGGIDTQQPLPSQV